MTGSHSRRLVATFIVLVLAAPVVAQSVEPNSIFEGPATPPLVTATPPDTISVAAFADPPMWARPQAYWLPADIGDGSTDITIDEAKAQLEAFKRVGLGGVTLEPGGPYDSVDITGPNVPGPGWPYKFLTPAWFEFLQAMLDKLDELDMTMYLLDVPLTMSGSAQGQVAQPDRCDPAPAPPLTNCGQPDLGWTTLTEVVPGVTYNQTTRPYWLDPLNPAAVQRNIDLNYGRHYQEVGEHFGNTLQAMWSDEVGFQPTGSPGTFCDFPCPDRPWSPTFPQYFNDLKGYELTPPLLNHIWHTDVDDPMSRRVRYDYYDAVSRRFADVYYGGLSRWSAEKGLGFIGQLLGEEDFPGHFHVEGSYYRPAAQPTIASLDLIDQFDFPGTPWCTNDGCRGITQKLSSSAAHLFGRKRVHMEAYDLANPELKERPQMLKALIDHGVSRGVNLFALHSYDGAGGGYNFDNVLFEKQRIWLDYTARLQYMFTPGTTYTDIAIGYAPEAFWVGDEQDTPTFAFTSAVLRSAHFGYDYFPLELATDPGTTIEDGILRHGSQSYRALVVPDWSTVSVEVMTRLRDFVATGGTLAAVGRVPTIEAAGCDQPPAPCAPLVPDTELADLVTEVFGFDPTTPPAAITNNSYFAGKAICMPGDFSASMQNLTPDRADDLNPLVDALRAQVTPRVQIENDPSLPNGLSAIQTLSYRRAGTDTYLVTNFPKWQSKGPGHFGFSHEFPGQPADIVLDVPWTGIPELWDVETGKVRTLSRYQIVGNRIRVPLKLSPYGSAVVRLRRTSIKVIPHVTDTNLLDVGLSASSVFGYLPAGSTGPAYAEFKDAQGQRHLEASASSAPPATLDPIYEVTFSDGMIHQRRAGPWSEPQPATGAPGRTYFVGSGTYRTMIDLPEATGPGRLLLDLGRAGDVAEVSVNGIEVGTRAWPAYLYDITDAVQSGLDELVVTVTVSRAADLPNDPLYPGGLLGPVTVRFEPLVTLPR